MQEYSLGVVPLNVPG